MVGGTMHTLWHFRLCPHSRSIRLALAEHGIGVALVEERPWDWRPEFLAVNPAGELPVLRLRNGPLLAGVYSIAEYLAETSRNAPGGARILNLFPGNREDRAEARRLVDWFGGKLHREVTYDLLRERVFPLVAGRAPTAPDVAMLRAVRQSLRYHLGYVAFLAYQRRWLAGDEPSFADLAAAAQFSTLDYLGEVPWDEYLPAKEWYSRMKSRPAVRMLLGERIPGLAPPLHYTDLDF